MCIERLPAVSDSVYASVNFVQALGDLRISDFELQTTDILYSLSSWQMGLRSKGTTVTMYKQAHCARVQRATSHSYVLQRC